MGNKVHIWGMQSYKWGVKSEVRKWGVKLDRWGMKSTALRCTGIRPDETGRS